MVKLAEAGAPVNSAAAGEVPEVAGGRHSAERPCHGDLWGGEAEGIPQVAPPPPRILPSRHSCPLAHKIGVKGLARDSA